MHVRLSFDVNCHLCGVGFACHETNKQTKEHPFRTLDFKSRFKFESFNMIPLWIFKIFLEETENNEVIEAFIIIDTPSWSLFYAVHPFTSGSRVYDL